MPVYKANALVLKRIPLGESDKIITLFTREYGKLNAVAKGSRKPTSRLAGASEPLSLFKGLFAEGKSLDLLTQCEVRESFPLIRADFDLFLRATYACELLERVTTERDAAPESFDLLVTTLQILQRARDADAVIHAYELQLTQQVGYEPILDVCVRCERTLNRDLPPVVYAPARGGALCGVCKTQVKEDVLPLSLPGLQALRRLSEINDTAVLAKAELPAEVKGEVNAALRSHLRLRLERGCSLVGDSGGGTGRGFGRGFDGTAPFSLKPAQRGKLFVLDGWVNVNGHNSELNLRSTNRKTQMSLGASCPIHLSLLCREPPTPFLPVIKENCQKRQPV